MQKHAFYARVSTEEQAEKGTIEGQVSFAKKYFDLHGIKDYELYIDDGVSGTIALKDRPEAKQMLKDVKDGKIKSVHVYRLDRLARSVKHVLDTYDLLEEKKVALVSMTEQFDTGTPTGKFFMTLLASIAALERDTILERTLLGKERAAKEGKWVTGQPPFGYDVGPDKRLVINESEAETVRLIFNLYTEGMSTIEAAKYLNAQGVLTPTQSKKSNYRSTGKWSASHISRILGNSVYTGTYQTMKRSKRDKRGVTIETPIIIEQEQFDKVAELLVKNAYVARGKKGRHYLLRGRIFCGECGRALLGNGGKSKGGRHYYRCSNTINAGAGRTCNAKLVRAETVEEAILRQIVDFLKNPNEVVEIVNKRIKDLKSDMKPVEKELSELEQVIGEKHKSRQTVVNLLTKGIITEQEAEEQLLSLAGEIGALNSRKEVLFERMQESKKINTASVDILQLLADIDPQEMISSEEKKALLVEAFVRRVDVYTIATGDGKHSKINVTFLLDPSCMGSHLCGDVQTHTTIEAAWEVIARSSGSIIGDRIYMR